MKKILLTGVNGQVGHALNNLLSNDYDLVALTRDQLDLTREDEIVRVVQIIKPDIIINPAAYTAVDKAETEQDLAFAINAHAPKILAQEANKIGASLIHFSTDYVYDGKKVAAYVETDEVNPLSVYGKSKLAGENAIREVGLPHLILRTSWVYSDYGKNFLKTILRLSAERDSLRIVADQYGTPTNSDDIAEGIQHLLSTWDVNNAHQSGTYHFTNAGMASWHCFACRIIEEYEGLNLPALKVKVDSIEAISTRDYPTPAVRPANSRLDCGQIKAVFNLTLPAWQYGLAKVMQKMVQTESKA